MAPEWPQDIPTVIISLVMSQALDLRPSPCDLNRDHQESVLQGTSNTAHFWWEDKRSGLQLSIQPDNEVWEAGTGSLYSPFISPAQSCSLLTLAAMVLQADPPVITPALSVQLRVDSRD